MEPLPSHTANNPLLTSDVDGKPGIHSKQQSSHTPTSFCGFLLCPWAPLSFLGLADAQWKNKRSGTLPNASHLWHQSEISLPVNFTVWGMKQLAKLTFKPSPLAMIKHLRDEESGSHLSKLLFQALIRLPAPLHPPPLHTPEIFLPSLTAGNLLYLRSWRVSDDVTGTEREWLKPSWTSWPADSP